MTADDADDFATWLKANPPPDVAEYVRERGGDYGAISEGDWREWDRRTEEWRVRRLARFPRRR